MSIRLRKSDVVRHFGNNMAEVGRACISPDRPNGINRISVRAWGEFVPELTARRLVERYPDLRDYVVDPETGLTLQQMREALKAEGAATERQA